MNSTSTLDDEVYLNGKYLPIEAASINILDRGFIFGDAVYEVLPVFNGIPFRVEQHLDRLDCSLQAMYLQNPLSRSKWQKIFDRLLTATGKEATSLYIQISRGVAARRHHIDAEIEPTVFVMRQTSSARPTEQGIRAITHADIRWSHCDIKSTSLAACILLRRYAFAENAEEAILLRHGQVTEGAASNVFVVTDGVILTPPKSRFILPGITRDLIVEILQKSFLTVQESAISESLLRSADEIWVTSSTWELTPVLSLDGVMVGNGIPGRVWQQVWEMYLQYKQQITGS